MLLWLYSLAANSLDSALHGPDSALLGLSQARMQAPSCSRETEFFLSSF